MEVGLEGELELVGETVTMGLSGLYPVGVALMNSQIEVSFQKFGSQGTYIWVAEGVGGCVAR